MHAGRLLTFNNNNKTEEAEAEIDEVREGGGGVAAMEEPADGFATADAKAAEGFHLRHGRRGAARPVAVGGRGGATC